MVSGIGAIPIDEKSDAPEGNRYSGGRTMINTITVADLMKTDLVTLSEEDSLDIAEQTMRFAKVHHLPVVDPAGRMLGIITQSDIIRVSVSSFADLTEPEDRAIKREILAKDIMVRQLTTVTPETTALHAARLLATHEYSCLPVVKDDRIVGLITDRDFLQLVIRALSEPFTGDLSVVPLVESTSDLRPIS